MNGLDSPLEAMALTPLNLNPLFSSILHNFWPFLAVLTAAMFTLRHLLLPSPLRTVVTPKNNTELLYETISQQVSQQQQKTTLLLDNVLHEDEDEDEEEEEEVVLTRGDSKKFFTIYNHEEWRNEEGCCCYADDVDVDGDELEEEEEVVVVLTRGDSKRFCYGGDDVEIVRGGEGELGWYEYQDRRVIDGSVVRLWDGCRRSGSKPNYERYRITE